MPANKEHAGKTGTNRARTREIVRFRSDFKCDFSFVSPRDTSRSDRTRAQNPRRIMRKQNGGRAPLLTGNVYRESLYYYGEPVFSL